VKITNELNLNFFLVTAHRQENVDVKEKLEGILDGLEVLYKEFCLPIIFPVHPRTKKRINDFRLRIPEGVKLIEPVGFLKFLPLEANAKLVLTDSGGVQEEACILGVPCITLRDNTERPETLEVGSNILAGTNKERILKCSKEMLNKNKERKWRNPFGDGKAGERIIKILKG
jgi:UDP-N-acetylglucosamine 2-epimerase (non-hydrolysing)